MEKVMERIRQNCHNYAIPKSKKEKTKSLKEYEVVVDFQGYVRGTKTFLVKASSTEEALQNYNLGVEVNTDIVRDDTEITNIDIVENT